MFTPRLQNFMLDVNHSCAKEGCPVDIEKTTSTTTFMSSEQA
jgi:hypothetical protein